MPITQDARSKTRGASFAVWFRERMLQEKRESMRVTLTRVPAEATAVSPVDEDKSGTSVTDEPRQMVMQRRLKESYGPTYLTLLSIIQGVALGDLASVVASGQKHFTLVQWVLTLNPF